MALDQIALHARLAEMERLDAQKHILSFGRRMTGLTPARHHIIIGKAIMQWIDSPTLDRMMIFAPPRHGKSWYCSRLAPSFLVGYKPGARMMHVTHSGRLSNAFGRSCRNMIGNQRFPWDDIRVLGDRKAAFEWETSNGCEYNAFGMDGATAGKPADYLFVDDPIKGRKEAFSEVARDSRWETIQYDLWSRLEGPQKQLWLLTRWNMDDPSGRVLGEDFDGKSGWYSDIETGERWYVLSLPAICEHSNDPMGREIGEWLWPEEHGDGKAIDAARKRGGYRWHSLYQQRPAPESGLFFDATNIQYYETTEIDVSELTIYGASDYAVTEEAGKNDPDYTVHAVFGIDREYNIYVLDMWRDRKTSDVWIDAFFEMLEKWKPVTWAEEGGQIIKSLDPFIKRTMLQKKKFYHRQQFTSHTSKEARAQMLLAMIQQKKLYLPRGLVWADLFIKELKQFPAGKHDDMVDTASLFCRLLAQLMVKKEKEKDTGPPPGSLESLYAAHEALEME